MPSQPVVSSGSALEAAFSARAGEPLRQFGYDLFASTTDVAPATDAAPGAIQGDYVLNTGDAVLVTLRGQKSFSKRFIVDRNGQLVVDDLRPLTAAGLTLDALRRDLAATVAATWPSTEAFASLAEVRRIGVLVTGAVRRPGRQEISAFATVLDALSAAGGVDRGGSLRAVRLMRTGGAATVDLYALQIAGATGNADIPLRDGDRLFVPPLGDTVAVAGPVKRPGIYELPPGGGPLSVAELRDLAGGALRPGRSRLLRFGIGPAGEETMEEIADAGAKRFGDGDLLLIAPEREDRRGEIRLEGHVLRPGPRALAQVKSLSGLLSRADLSPTAYLAFAILESPTATTEARRLRPVDPLAVLNGRDRRQLAEGDTLHVLGTADVDFLTSEPVLALLRGERQPPQDACPGLVALARILAAEPAGPLATGPQARAAATLTGSRAPCPPLFTTVPDLLPLALRHSVLRLTGVPRPGFYPVADGAESTDATSGARETIVEPEAPHYELIGHVRRPGTRRLSAGTTLRQALAEGKALKRDVYPLLGIVERYDRRTLTRIYLPFSPQEISAGRADRSLSDGDRIHLFATEDIRNLVKPDESATESKAENETESSMLAALLDPTIVAVIGERTVQVRGAVRDPGGYPVADRTPLTALVAAAGGLSAEADPTVAELTTVTGTRSRVDLTRDGTRAVGPGDALRINPRPQALESRAVAIEGAVRRPGRYDIGRGETLSSLIARAGGLIDDAYPAGAVLTRESERRREREQFQRQARELERTLALEVEKGEPVKAENVALARQLAAQLRGAEPLGRVVVEADPAILRSRPDLDPLLEPDDRIQIPKRPLTVAVSGEVLHPTTAQFVSGKTAEDYMNEAGGPTRDADTGRSFLVLPDGRARPLALSSWNHRVETIPPGTILVVPRDPRPFDGLDATKAIGNILSQLAITAASISVITR
ncbi:protein involved in polysaccharide export with SLBB domain [Azospirillum lipoferum]|uniref:SLBB domain-containing protein n=1 Tax=Azospirillum TaxID=191 RepID=UPI001FE4EF86|nr:MULTISPECIES: SLBB domain-containing protein [Azospirillum]MCP1608979.1 protein involved in polysaccharide export with SLBB domain [Azospirillum lipoferum]MDW5535708.1 SLBB domain-containing protein [Azospirillum sp. NL1]